MAKGKSGGSQSENIALGTDSWNVADGFTKAKILRQLVMIDRWDTLAQFGTEDVGDDQYYTDIQIKKRRVESLERLHSTIKQLLGNCFFKIQKRDRKVIRWLIERVNNAGDFIGDCYKQYEDEVSRQEIFEINERLFHKILRVLQDVKEELNIPLNNAGLIFRPSEEVDLDSIMEDIVQGG